MIYINGLIMVVGNLPRSLDPVEPIGLDVDVSIGLSL